MKDINKHLEIIMKFRSEHSITDDDFKLLLEGFKDICIDYGRLDHAKDSPLDEVFDSMFNIFKPKNQK